jgi:hypothetical protein
MSQSGSGDIKQTGRELAQDAKSAVSNATSQVKSEVQGQVADITNAAQEQTTHFLDEQKDMAAQRIEGVAQALRHAGEELAGRDEGTLAQYTDSLAGQLDRFSNSLREREIGSLIEDAKQLAYRQPELFVAGALAAGFVIGRFFKSSRRPSAEYDYSYGEYDPRDPSRMYGQQYGESYNQEFGSSYSPEYSQGYGSGYRSGYSTGYGSDYDNQARQRSGGQYGESSGQRSSQDSAQSFGQGSAQSYSQGSSQGSSQRSSQGSGQGFAQSGSQSTGQRTTHGLGTGQSIDRESDLIKGQEFGQGEEQVSNRRGEDTVTNRSSQQSGSQRPNPRQGGDAA